MCKEIVDGKINKELVYSKNMQDLQHIVAEIKRNITEDNLISIILFGSAVNSIISAHDFDILIITKNLPPKDWIVAGNIKANLLGKIQKPVDIIFLEEKDLVYPSAFLYEVTQKYQLMYGKDFLSTLKNATENVQIVVDEGNNIGWHIA